MRPVKKLRFRWSVGSCERSYMKSDQQRLIPKWALLHGVAEVKCNIFQPDFRTNRGVLMRKQAKLMEFGLNYTNVLPTTKTKCW